MKLRIRFRGRREVIELANRDVPTIREVKHCVGLHLSLMEAAFDLSLDGKTPLPSDEGLTLADLGIVGGDLLHVLIPDNISGNRSTGESCCADARDRVDPGILAQQLQLGVPEDTAVRALCTTKNASLNEALDILNRDVPSTSNTNNSPNAIQQSRTDKISPANIDQPGMDAPVINTGDKAGETATTGTSDTNRDTNSESLGTNQSLNEDPKKLRKIEYTPKALLCRDGIPYSLQVTYELATVTTLHEAVCVAVHVLLLETGFVNRPTEESAEMATITGPSTSTAVKTKASDDDSYCQFIPEKWKSKTGAKFVYTHPACPGVTCSVTCTSLGPYVLAHGMSNSSSCNEVHQCRLPAADFVKGNIDLRSKGAAEVYKNLQRLSMLVKDQIAYPLLSSMRHELNLEEIYGFMALPTEVKLMILCLLPVKYIIYMAVTCREMQALASDHSLWQHLCVRDFGLLTKGKYSSWKMEYMRHYKDMTEREKNRQRFVHEQGTHHGPAGIFSPYPPFSHPGIIGGQHDLFPNVPFMPGGLHPPPGTYPTPGHMPRPRFDPYGPVPDMDILPGPHRRPRGRGRGELGRFPPGPFF